MARSKDPGTRFPFINLEKAMERARRLYEADPQCRQMAIPTAFAAWGYSEKSSGGNQTIAALKMYGLIEDSGANEDRRVNVTSDGQRYFLDEREDERSKLARKFALQPRLIAALWDEWHDQPPGDAVARSHLKLDRKLNEQSARSLLGIYKDNLTFAELKGAAAISPQPKDDDGDGGDGINPPVINPPVVNPPAAGSTGDVKIMEGERVVFTEEVQPAQYLKVVASGELDEVLLEALEDYIKRQRKRLGVTEPATPETK